jgi:hypothetical protein
MEGEYMGKEFKEICGELGIIHETTSPYTPEHNGIAERYNQTLQEGALTLQHESELSNKFWVSAVHTVNFIRNWILHSHIGQSPYEAFWDSKPKLDWLRTYGSRCWALVPKAIRRKGEYKSIEGIFVRYYDDSKAYKVWVPRTHSILKARDVIFYESSRIERVTIHANDEDDLPDLWNDRIPISATPSIHTPSGQHWSEEGTLPFAPDIEATPSEEGDEERKGMKEISEEEEKEKDEGEQVEDKPKKSREEKDHRAPKDFEAGPWLDPENTAYGRGKRHQALLVEVANMAHGISTGRHRNCLCDIGRGRTGKLSGSNEITGMR